MNTMTMTLTTPLQADFEILWQRSQRRAYSLAYRLTGNSADAEDVTQDAYLRAWTHFDSYDRAYSFEAWLNRIITNRVIDLHRRRIRVPMLSLDAPHYEDTDGQTIVQETAAPHSSPEEIVLSPMMDERLERALAALPDRYRKVVWLYDVEERSYLEIADALQCASGTVRSRIHRARQMLRNYMTSGYVTPAAGLRAQKCQ